MRDRDSLTTKNPLQSPIVGVGTCFPAVDGFLHLAAGAAALPAVSWIAWAQTYPTRPVHVIVGFTAGTKSFA
jgi:hypothetical protein